MRISSPRPWGGDHGASARPARGAGRTRAAFRRSHSRTAAARGTARLGRAVPAAPGRGTGGFPESAAARPGAAHPPPPRRRQLPSSAPRRSQALPPALAPLASPRRGAAGRHAGQPPLDRRRIDLSGWGSPHRRSCESAGLSGESYSVAGIAPQTPFHRHGRPSCRPSTSLQRENKTWMRGPSPRMTTVACAIHLADSSEGHKNFPRTVLRFRGDDGIGWVHLTESALIGRCRDWLRLSPSAGPARSRRHLGDARALLPEPARCGVVLRRLARPGRPAIGEIAAADRRHLGRRGEIDDGLRALLRRDREELGDADAEAEEAAVVVAEAAGDEAGV